MQDLTGMLSDILNVALEEDEPKDADKDKVWVKKSDGIVRISLYGEGDGTPEIKAESLYGEGDGTPAEAEASNVKESRRVKVFRKRCDMAAVIETEISECGTDVPGKQCAIAGRYLKVPKPKEDTDCYSSVRFSKSTRRVEYHRPKRNPLRRPNVDRLPA